MLTPYYQENRCRITRTGVVATYSVMDFVLYSKVRKFRTLHGKDGYMILFAGILCWINCCLSLIVLWLVIRWARIGMNKYRPPLRVYRMNHYDFVSARSRIEAMRVYREYLSECRGKGSLYYHKILHISKPVLLSDEELIKYVFEDRTGPTLVKRSFRHQLNLTKEPGFFASTE